MTLVLAVDLIRDIAFVWHSLSPSHAVANMSPRPMPFPLLYHRTGAVDSNTTRQHGRRIVEGSRKLTRLIRNSTPITVR